MHNPTIACPNPGTEAYFSFKEPLARSVQARLGIASQSILLKVAAVNEPKEMIQSELRDPFLEAYAPAGLEQSQYEHDLRNDTPIITFKHTNPAGQVRYVRVPLSFIEDFSAVVDIQYINKTLVLDFAPQHKDLDLSVLHADIADFVKSRTGLDAVVREVSIGDAVSITSEEHATREAIRQGGITVTKTLSVQLEELQLKYSSMVSRIHELGIVLG